MRSLSVVLALTFACGFVSAEPLSDADRETLLERLDSLKAEATASADLRFRAAVSAYTAAMASDDAAMELYLKCVEKVDFDDEKKKPGEFREWKRKEEEKLSKPSLKLALRHQLRWLVLTLQAASEKADRAKLDPLAQQALDAVFRDIEPLKDQQGVLKQAVTSTVFAKAYEINNVKVEKWPMSPIDVPAIYDQIILPRYRNPAGLTQLRENWLKRIQQEGAIQEYWAGAKEQPKNGEKEKFGTPASGTRSPEFEKFITTTLPTLQWQMEMDLFKAGDQSGAAIRMLAHIEKNITHPAAKEWGDQLRHALTPEPAGEKGEKATGPDGKGM